LGVEKKESKAVLVVVSDRRGEVCSAGAMVRTVVFLFISDIRHRPPIAAPHFTSVGSIYG
jgi:hypothetical protein